MSTSLQFVIVLDEIKEVLFTENPHIVICTEPRSHKFCIHDNFTAENYSGNVDLIVRDSLNTIIFIDIDIANY